MLKEEDLDPDAEVERLEAQNAIAIHRRNARHPKPKKDRIRVLIADYLLRSVLRREDSYLHSQPTALRALPFMDNNVEEKRIVREAFGWPRSEQ